jgi:hypothetical protein
MNSKESSAEKAEKKSDEKAPQLRDEANRATEDFKLLDSQLMERLRNWQSSKSAVFNKVYVIVSDVLTAPNSVGGGGGGGATFAPGKDNYFIDLFIFSLIYFILDSSCSISARRAACGCLTALGTAAR